VFLGNARAALIVAITIPLSLLIAFICMDGAKIPANLLSIGAVDFGMIVDGSIVMVENIFRLITSKQEHGESYDLRELIRSAAREVARPIVFAIGIIVTAYLPIFTLQRVEGKLFRPMAWTVAFALLGALLLSITLVPVLTTFLFKGKLKEFHNPLLERVRRLYLPQLRWALTRPRWALLAGLVLLVGDGVMASNIGSEFLPHLDDLDARVDAREHLAGRGRGPGGRGPRRQAQRDRRARDPAALPGDPQHGHPDRSARRRHRSDRLLQR